MWLCFAFRRWFGNMITSTELSEILKSTPASVFQPYWVSRSMVFFLLCLPKRTQCGINIVCVGIKHISFIGNSRATVMCLLLISFFLADCNGIKTILFPESKLSHYDSLEEYQGTGKNWKFWQLVLKCKKNTTVYLATRNDNSFTCIHFKTVLI